MDENYSKVEDRVLSRLKLDKTMLLEGKPQIFKAVGEFRRTVRMELLHPELIESVPANRLKFRLYHDYNIFATGREEVTIDILKSGETKTRVTVDYFENAKWFAIIPTAHAGGSKEPRMLKLLLDD